MFDGVIAAEPEIARRFPEGKTALVRNFPILEELVRRAGVTLRGAPSAVRALRRERSRGCGGWGRWCARCRHCPRGWGRARAGGAVPPGVAPRPRCGGRRGCASRGTSAGRAVAAWLGRARVGLVVLHRVPKYVAAYPTKLFEYMAAGVPVIASNFPLWKAIVDEAGCGLTVDPYDADALAEAMRWLLEHPEEAEAMGERGRVAVRERYGWDGEARAAALVLSRPHRPAAGAMRGDADVAGGACVPAGRPAGVAERRLLHRQPRAEGLGAAAAAPLPQPHVPLPGGLRVPRVCSRPRRSWPSP
jgi:hypothetical protein